MIKISRQQRNGLLCLGLALAVIAVYAPVRHFEFINYDDLDYVSQNSQVQSGLTLQGVVWAFTTNHDANWHPLTWISHMLDCQLFGLDAGKHHLVNVLLHIASTLLLFQVLNRMTAAPWRSALVAALFGLHPLHVESVAWVAERKDVLSAFFWMLTLWTYVCYVQTPHASRSAHNCFYALTLVFFTLGLMAKPMVVTLPFVLLLLDYWPLGRTQWAKPAVGERTETSLGRLVIEKLPFLVLAAASCVTTIWAQRSGGAIVSMHALAFGDRSANAVVSYVRYIGKMFWPTDLAVFYPYHEWSLSMVLWAAAALLGITGVVVWRVRREPHLAVGWLWYVGTLVPAIGLVQAGAQSSADRYTYLPLIGLSMMVAWSVPRGVVEERLPKLAIIIVAITLVSACAVLCRLQVGHWKNSETLFRRALEVTHANWVAHNNLALALDKAGRLQEATEHFEQALHIKPEYAESHYNLGLVLKHQGRFGEATEHFERALQLKPDSADTHNNLGATLWQLGRTQEAMGHYELALRLKPDLAEAHYNLGLALAQGGRIEEAIDHWEQALRSKPDYAEAHYNLGVTLEQLGQMPEAVGHYEQALRIKPDYLKAHYNLGVALARLGRLPEAIRHYEEALRIRSDYAEAHNGLGLALVRLGRVPEAIDHWEQALRSKPDDAEVHFNLGVALEGIGRTPEAIRHFEQALRIQPDFAQAQKQLAKLQNRQ